jgi:hypothetical protein
VGYELAPYPVLKMDSLADAAGMRDGCTLFVLEKVEFVVVPCISYQKKRSSQCLVGRLVSIC